ncbi:NTP transferase domain-containing protein [Erwinia sp. BNK-24-b]|uniref:NTP transferase domain-containing protein n=1 Tax=Erwinia TaxID=551 RepID=UPI001FEE76BE
MKQCIMLAAGLSSRMGHWKMLLPWKDLTVLDSALQNALAFCDTVILVTGHRAAELRQRYADRPSVRLCHNADYMAGMFSSVRCGAAALLPGERFFIVPGDMPAIDPNVYRLLWHYRTCYCLLPSYAGGNGHPALLPAIMREHILAAPETETLRTLMQICGRESLPVTSSTIHWDVDTPAQYQRLLTLFH